jgi:Ca-activated chloride channel family protein
MVVSFDSTAELVADLTDSTEDLAKAIRNLRPGGGTALYDAIYFACKEKLMGDQPRDKFRRALVILTDGDDNDSRMSREQALEMAHKADVVVYTISTNITRIPTDGDKVLRYFAEETGGLAFFPFKSQDLAQSFENIANRKDLIVRARHGYYAPKF